MDINEPHFRQVSHTILTPDERPHLDDGVISLGWNAGTIHIQYVGLEKVPDSAVEDIKAAVQRFNVECQLMALLYAGVLSGEQAIQDHFDKTADTGGELTISGRYQDGSPSSIWARLPIKQVLDAFARGGEFESLYAKSFVVFAYQTWDEDARPRIAEALGLNHKNIESDFMGEWRHLRNWLVHPSEENERRYFDNAKTLAVLLDELKPGNPEMKAHMVFPLIGYLNSLRVIINPKELDPAIAIDDGLDPKLIEQISMEYKDTNQRWAPLWRGFRHPGDR